MGQTEVRHLLTVTRKSCGMPEGPLAPEIAVDLIFVMCISALQLQRIDFDKFVSCWPCESQFRVGAFSIQSIAAFILKRNR